MATILDNKRAELDALILLMQEEIDVMKVAVEKREAQLSRLREQRHELDAYQPAVSPDDSED